jgi:hypothetical protein
MEYDPKDPFHRTFLATHIQEALTTAGFVLQPAPHAFAEEVWKRGVEGTKFQIAVYTTIVAGQVRSVGADAIRVVGLYENAGQVKGKLKSRSVHRTGKVEAIKERMLNRARSTWSECRSNGKCKCGAPLMVSKKGKKYCADICWKT